MIASRSILYSQTKSKMSTLAHLELLTIEAISYLWVSVRAFHKFIANMLSGVIWIGKILSLFSIRPPIFSTIHTRLHPLLPRLADLFVISKMLMLLRNIIDAECARLIILCYTALNVVHRFPCNDSYLTTPLTLRPLDPERTQTQIFQHFSCCTTFNCFLP